MPARKMLTFLLLACPIIAGTLAGCAPRGIEIIDFDFRSMPSDAPLAEKEAIPQRYWWIDEGTLYVVAGRGSGLQGDHYDGRQVAFSLALPGLPAEKARNYPVNGATLRAYARQSPNHARYRSRQGIAAVWLLPGEQLRVRFRTLARKEIFHILTGWTETGDAVLVGEFRATYDETRGKVLLARSEEDGMNRGTLPNTPPGRRGMPVPVTGPSPRPIAP